MYNNYGPFNYPYYNSYNPYLALRGVSSTIPASRASGLGNIFSSLRSPSAFASAAPAAKSFSFSGLLSGASKTVNVLNQAVPLVYQVKPLWNNTKTMFRMLKAVKSDDKETINEIKKDQEEKINYQVNNNPNFFL